MKLPKHFDLAIVDYNGYGAGKGAVIAPLWSMNEGETIETTVGRGVVIYSCSSSPDDETFKMISMLTKVDIIHNKIVPVKFKEIEDGLSEE